MISANRKVHLFNDRPHIYEIDDMLAFCKQYESVYIYGIKAEQEYLLKFFDICGVGNIAGYTVREHNNETLAYRELPIERINDVIKKEKTGVILAISDRHYGSIIPYFRREGFTDFFLMTEHTKKAVAGQLTPRPINEMTFEVSLADHCNLDCQMCDHYSQLSEERFLDLEAFERDITQMAKIFKNQMACITLTGGEPLLHKDIIKFMEISRRLFPATQIIILTNGLLLPKLENSPNGNIWQACKEYEINITITLYPINFDYTKIQAKAKEYGVRVGMSSNIHADEPTKIIKVSDKHTLDPSKSQKPYFPACLYFNKFNVLKNGRLYMCPVSAHIGILNKYFDQSFELTEQDSLDIFKVENWKDFAEFTAKRVPFCQYCDIKNWKPFTQWTSSTKELSEYL